MYRILVILLLTAFIRTASAVGWNSINIDYKTATAMGSAYAAESLEEQYSASALDSILNHYKKASIAVAGIYVSKQNDRNAMRNPGLFATEENYYYARILRKVRDGIMPKLISVASKMLKYPENALYWGPYLCKTTQNVENLCKEFELVVTNGKLSFKDVQFLLINEKLRKVFELVELGNMDWKSMLNKLGEFGKGLDAEDLKEDMGKLGNVLSQAGQQTLDANMQKASKIGEIFHSSTSEVKNLYNSFKNSYEDLRNGRAVKDLLMKVIVTPDAAGVAKLFEVSDYNLTGYISNYIKELQGQYYTQRWYIYTEESGGKVLCDYKPESYEDRKDGRWNTAWNHYVSPEDKEYCHTLTSAERQELKNKAEQQCGWSQKKVDEYKKNNPGHNCYISYILNHIDFRQSYKPLFGSRHYKRHCFYSYSVYVYDSWYIKHDVYEEIFDSQKMDKETFLQKMQARLRNYNENTDIKDENYGLVYKLGSDAPRYYTMADQKKMEGCNSASFVAKCHDGATLAEGAFNWKENGNQGSRLEDPKSKEFAMRNSSADNEGEKELLESQKKYTEEVNSLKREISQNDAQMQALIEKIYQAKLANNATLVNQLQQEYDRVSDMTAKLKTQLSEAQSNLSQANTALDEYYKDLDDNLDGPYRIPSNMTELQSMFKLQWQDEGEWVNSSDGFVFVRHAYCPSANTTVTYTATLKLARKPKYFLGIRIHRAILSVEYKLTSSTDSENVIEVMKLDMSKSEQQRADEVNNRLKELMADMPDCTISIKYEYANDVDISNDDDDDAVHLLWASDRLDIARDVDYQLTAIYAQLVLLEKVLDSRLSLLDFLKRQILDVVSRSGRGTIAEYALQRWESASFSAMNKTNGTNNSGQNENTKK